VQIWEALTESADDGTAPTCGDRSRDRHVGRFGPLSIDPHGRQVALDGVPIRLTKGQYELLLALVYNEGAVVPFADLHRVGCGVSPWTRDTRALRQQMAALCRKLGDDARMIVNVRGVGYAIRRHPVAAATPSSFDTRTQAAHTPDDTKKDHEKVTL
jgi:DNA-binding response OmpR family regulator